jgi:uncharacterized alkaline shock family protein YloU
MSDYEHPPGKVTVSPGVLMAIAHMSARGVPGVKAVGRTSSSRAAMLRGRTGSGVNLTNHDGLITGDMFLVVKAGFNVRDVCREVQRQVARALQEMAGMGVARLDIHVEDIDYEGAEA